MSTISDEIKAAIALANESYTAGYKEGYAAGSRDATAKAIELIKALPETPPDTRSPAHD